METLYFGNIIDFINEINMSTSNIVVSHGDISIIAKYDEAKQIIDQLIRHGYFIASIRLSSPDYDNYYDEYIISVNEDGIWCDQMLVNGKYLYDESTVTYIMSNCSSKVIPACKSKRLFEVHFKYLDIDDDVDDENDEDDEFYYDDCDLNECLHCGSQVDFDEINKDGMHGFTAEKSDGDSYMRYSLYTTTDLSKADIQSLLQEAGF